MAVQRGVLAGDWLGGAALPIVAGSLAVYAVTAGCARSTTARDDAAVLDASVDSGSADGSGLADGGAADAGSPPCPTPPGSAQTFAGTGEAGFNGDGQPALETQLHWPRDVAFSDEGRAYIVDANNHRIRRIAGDGTVETIVGSDFVGDGDPAMEDRTPPGADGTQVLLNHPADLLFRPDGTLLIAAAGNHKLRVWNPEDGLAYVLAGGGAGYAGDGAPLGAETRFDYPSSVAQDGDGNLFILDQRNLAVRRAGPVAAVTTHAGGTDEPGFAGDGGPPADAQLHFEQGPTSGRSGGLALGPDGALYVADGLNHRIRRIAADGRTIETVVGTGEAGYGGDCGPGIDAQLSHPRDLELGPDGRLYIADADNHRIRAWDPDTGIVETVAGSGDTEPSEDERPATEAGLDRPVGVAFDSAGAMYIADTFNHRIVKVTR